MPLDIMTHEPREGELFQGPLLVRPELAKLMEYFQSEGDVWAQVGTFYALRSS
jgi:hypothetical protein